MILSVEENEDFLPAGIFDCSNQRQPRGMGEVRGLGDRAELGEAPSPSPLPSHPSLVSGGLHPGLALPQALSWTEGHQPHRKSSKQPRHRPLLLDQSHWKQVLLKRFIAANMRTAELCSPRRTQGDEPGKMQPEQRAPPPQRDHECFTLLLASPTGERC